MKSIRLARLVIALCIVAATATPALFADDDTRPAPDPAINAAKRGLAVATFAGGCFWCVEHDFDEVPGVVETTSGFTGGTKQNPTYEEVSAGGTGHAESVQVLYDPKKVTYARLLEFYWHNIDPTVKDQQFCDHGHQYRTAIFVRDAEQRKLAEASRAAVARELGQPIYTEVVQAGKFWPAEVYHQDYYRKNPIRYKFYRFNCGRDQRLKAIWGDKAGH